MVNPSLDYVDGTELARSAERRTAFESALEDVELSQTALSGRFSSNLWGDRYEITGLLGRGAQGVTFAGIDRRTEQPVAIKLFDLSSAKDWKAHELFEREILALASIEHDQVPHFFEVLGDEQSGAKALVMERVLGDDLDVILEREGPLTEADLWRVLVEMAEVLTHLHDIRPPIVHRDIKPRNIVRRSDGRHCLVDFGGVTALTKKGASTVVGTFGFMAPEQLYGGASAATDVYALGATLLHLATGVPPDEQPRKGLALDVDQAAPGMSPALRAMMKEMLNPEPDQRPASGKALQDRLDEVDGGFGGEDEMTDPQGFWGRGKRKKKKGKSKRSKGYGNKVAQPPVEVIEAKTDARFASPRDDETSVMVTSGARMAIGVLGTLLVVAVGEVFLPLLLTVLAQFSVGSSQKRLLAARDKVKRAAGVAKDGFGRSIDKGARGFEEIEHRQRRKNLKAPPKKRSKGRRR